MSWNKPLWVIGVIFLHLVASVDISCSQLCSSLILTTIPWLLRVFTVTLNAAHTWSPAAISYLMLSILLLYFWTLTWSFCDLSVRFQTTQRGSWHAVAVGHSKTRPSSTCPFSSRTVSSRFRVAPARWLSVCVAATRRATSCHATLRPTACPPASAGGPWSPSWPAFSSCWVSCCYDDVQITVSAKSSQSLSLGDIHKCCCPTWFIIPTY